MLLRVGNSYPIFGGSGFGMLHHFSVLSKFLVLNYANEHF